MATPQLNKSTNPLSSLRTSPNPLDTLPRGNNPLANMGTTGVTNTNDRVAKALAIQQQPNLTTRQPVVTPVNPPKINAENIQPATGTYTTVQPKPYTNTQIAVDSTAEKQVIQPKEQPKEETQRTQVQSYLDKLLSRDIASEKAKLREDVGLMAKQEEYNKWQDELKRTKSSYEKQMKELEKNKEGKFGGGLEKEMADLRRTMNAELADIAINAEFALNNYQGAEKILNAQIQDLNDEYDMQVKNYQLAQDFLQNDLTESEKLQIQNNMQIEKEKRDNAEYRLRASYDNALKASTGGGGGSVTPQQQVLQQLSTKDNIDAVNSLLEHKGLSSSVGANPLGRFNIFNPFTGNKADFIASTETLTGQLTLTNLINAKANGATFGALSEGELKLLENSATKINEWAIKNDQGKTVGYNANPADFKRELDKISNMAKRDYILKGGNPADVGALVMPDGTVVAPNSDGTITQIY